MVEPLRHRQTKGAATDMFDLQPPRHIPTLPKGGILDAGQLLPLAPNQQTISELCRTSFDGEGLASRTAAVPQTAADFRHRQWCDLPELIVSMN
ncbi:MAG TPA: hypothetical protein VNS33_17125 [Bradyrhizobium sp.]|nr:hypothetical protein [Bradyrhizobium sp.]